MKNVLKGIWTIFVFLVIGFYFSSCYEESAIIITGEAIIGGTIIASIAEGGLPYAAWEGKYKWELSKTNNPYVWQSYIFFNPNVETGAINQIFTLVPGTFKNVFEGYYIRASRYMNGHSNKRWIYSNVLGPILSVD